MITKQNKKNYVNYTALLIKCLHNYVCAFWISSECCWFWPRHPRRHAPNCVNHLPTKFGISPLPMNLLLRESAINSTQSTAVKHNTNTHRQLVKQSTSTIAQSLRWADTQRDIPNDRVCAPRRDTILYVCVTDHLLHENNFRSQSENSTIYININCMTMLIRKRLYNSACSWYITTEKKIISFDSPEQSGTQQQINATHTHRYTTTGISNDFVVVVIAVILANGIEFRIWNGEQLDLTVETCWREQFSCFVLLVVVFWPAPNILSQSNQKDITKW